MVESSWNMMAHGDAREGKWRGNWRMEWVASTLHTTSEHGVSSITTADAHTSAASSRLNWRPRRFKWTRPFRRKTKSGFCVCAITFQTQSACWVKIAIPKGSTRLCAFLYLKEEAQPLSKTQYYTEITGYSPKNDHFNKSRTTFCNLRSWKENFISYWWQYRKLPIFVVYS